VVLIEKQKYHSKHRKQSFPVSDMTCPWHGEGSQTVFTYFKQPRFLWWSFSNNPKYQ